MIKTKTITTDKATILVVDIDDLKEMIGVEQGCIWYLRHLNNQLVDKTIKLPQGKWRLLGRLPDITEEQADKVVDSMEYHPISAKDQLINFLQANEIYFDNPLGERPVQSEFYWGFLHDLGKWQEAQSKVWDKERTYLFIKVD